MTPKMVLAAAIAAASLAGAPAHAAEAPAAARDAKCALLGFALATSDEQEVSQAGLMLAFYYYGRFSTTGADVERRLKAIADSMTDESLRSEGDRCARELEAVGESMKRFGESMEPAP